MPPLFTKAGKGIIWNTASPIILLDDAKQNFERIQMASSELSLVSRSLLRKGLFTGELWQYCYKGMILLTVSGQYFFVAIESKNNLFLFSQKILLCKRRLEKYSTRVSV